jgi:MoxR-like ATPase
MARKLATQTRSKANENGFYTGKYVESLASIAIASILARQHLMVIGPPGWGKTDVLDWIGKQVAGSGYRFARLEPTAPPEKIRGPIRLSAYLENDVYEFNSDGTPYDKDATVVLLDEAHRPSDPVFDLLIDLLNRKDVPIDLRPVVWGTANFLVENERIEALNDRFALWYWMETGMVDMDQMGRSMLANMDTELAVRGTFPTWEQVKEIRAMLPGESAVEAIIKFTRLLREEAAAQKLIVHPRRQRQWMDLIFRYAAYITGSNNFTVVPPQVAGIMKYAWTCPTREMFVKWAEICGAVADPLAALLESVGETALEQFKKYGGANQSSANIVALGSALANAQATLEEYAGDPRTVEMNDKLNEAFAKALQGKDPMEEGV